MVAIALAWLIVPLMRRRRSTALGREASNVAILRDQLRELDQDLASGAITPVQHEQARRELESRVLEESSPGEERSMARVPASGGGQRVVWALAAIVPVAAVALYGLL